MGRFGDARKKVFENGLLSWVWATTLAENGIFK
jgi:hypothetical protein